MKSQQRAELVGKIRRRFLAVKDTLTERARRLFVAGEALSAGHGGLSAAAVATGMSKSVIGRGMVEVKAIEAGEPPSLAPTRSRRPGAGRKKATVNDPTLLADLKTLVESTTRGEPDSPLLWTARSQRNLVEALAKQSHVISLSTLAGLLRELGYSLQGNRKRLEGAQHPDRNAQFEHINEVVRRQGEANEPAISVDTKKKELVGPYKNGGCELRPQRDPESVLGHDFPDPEVERASPYGVYDIAKNEAWVSVGIGHDTAEFSVNAIRTWWNEMGAQRYPDAKSLLVTADGGGSNGYRLRLWKLELQTLADEIGMTIKVCHLPPGTSKWNKVEHRLFSFISQNWRGKPLLTHQVIVELIASTRTRTGLTVRCALDTRHYASGRRVSDHELAFVHLKPDNFHGEWNYSIVPAHKDEH